MRGEGGSGVGVGAGAGEEDTRDVKGEELIMSWGRDFHDFNTNVPTTHLTLSFDHGASNSFNYLHRTQY